MLNDERNEGYHRLFVGERWLLYACFLRFFNNDSTFEDQMQDLFYLYLLLKSNFRSEIVQVNRRRGFRNFSQYQNRKSMFWEKYPEYWAEGYRVAINGTIRDNKLNSMEVRIMPEDTKADLIKTISITDREVYFARKSYPGDRRDYPVPEKDNVLAAGQEMEHFYVIHFPKRKLKHIRNTADSSERLLARNADVRSKTRRQALTLAKALTKNRYLCMRIRGIDGCSAEIGCRPETFATEFRFLREFIPVSEFSREIWRPESDIQPVLSATYHVGEDFLDIADGLRAIDEAVIFLNLKRKDRLGHALALGIEPQPY